MFNEHARESTLIAPTPLPSEACEAAALPLAAVKQVDPGEQRLNSKDPHFRKWVTAFHNTPGFNPLRDDSAPFRGMEPPTRWETWGEVADRVAEGNASLLANSNRVGPDHVAAERAGLRRHIAQASVLMSGRHLQHGDANQSQRPQEWF